MANSTQAQRIKLCDFCQDPVQNLCRGCKYGLCSNCTANHFLLNPSKIHDVVPFRYGTGNRRLSRRCACLSSEKPIYYCFDCCNPFCVNCEGVHDQHTSGCVSEHIHVLVEILQGQNLELMNNIIPWYQSAIDAVLVKLSELPAKYSKFKEEINSHRRFLHECIDEIFDRNLEKLDLMESSHRENLLEERDKYRKQFISMNKLLRHNNDVLKDHELLQTGEKQSIFKNLSNPYSKLLEKNLPLFEKNYDGLREKLEEIAGSLHEQNPKFTSSFIIPPPYIRFEARKTITNPRLVSLLSAEFYCGDIVCEKGGTSWVCGLGSRHITQYDVTRGKTGNLISVTSQPSFLAINSLGHIFYSEFRDSSVKYVTHKIPELFTKTQGWQPRGINCCLNDDVLVSEFSENLQHSRIVRYDTSGRCLNVFEFKEENAQHVPLFDDVLFICENKNGDIGVTERYKSCVIAVKKNGQKRFEYSGHLRSSSYTEFEFAGIGSDSRCNFMISDPKNYTLHLVDWQGKFLFYVFPGEIIAPMALCVDEEDRVWVTEARGTIRIITYIDH